MQSESKEKEVVTKQIMRKLVSSKQKAPYIQGFAMYNSNSIEYGGAT